MEHHVLDLLARDGIWLLFAAQTLGIVGLPVPDELILMLAGGLVRKSALGGAATVAAAVAGSIAGTTVSYALGRTGARVLHRVPAIEGATGRAQLWFKRWGKWLLAFGYFVPGVRHVTAIAAGSSALDFRLFCAYAYPGAAVWSTAFLALGYYAGAGGEWENAVLLLRTHVASVAAVLVALSLAYAFGKRRACRADGNHPLV